MIKLSIIVPVYNVELYLDRCVTSLLRQGLKDSEYEIILVDDGSTDNSLGICQRFATHYRCIHYVSQKNQGPATARNTGILAAKGEFVCFVDSDDYLDDYGLATLLQHEPLTCDLIRFWSRIIYGGKPSIQSQNSQSNLYFQGDGFTYIEEYGLETFCWNYLYKRSFLLDHSLFFEDVLVEDFRFMVNVLFANPSIHAYSFRFYNYEIRQNSRSTAQNVPLMRRWVKDLSETLLQIVQLLRPKETTRPSFYHRGMESVKSRIPLLFSRMLGANFTLSEYRATLVPLKSEGLLPLPITHSTRKVVFSECAVNLLFRFSFLYYPAKTIYRHLFLPYIKPKLNRDHK